MNEQEQQRSAIPEQIISLPPKNNFWKPIIMIVLVLIVAIIAGGLYISTQKKTSSVSIKDVKNPETFNDSDLKINYTTIPAVSDNSAPIFNALSSSSISTSDLNTLVKYIASSTTENLPPVVQASKLISKYSILLKAFDENATKPYQCNLGKGEICSLNVLRHVSYLAGTRALVLYEQNKTTDAQKTVSNLLSLGKNITANADTEISLLIGWISQKTGYSVSNIIYSKYNKSTYSIEEKNILISQLRNEHKKALQYAYTRISDGIDYITSPDKKPLNQVTTADDEEYISEYRKAIAENPSAWNPIETKKYFYDSYKIMISSVDLPCGANLPESKIETGFNLNDEKTENYIGKTMYSTAYAEIDGLNTKRCEVESAI